VKLLSALSRLAQYHFLGKETKLELWGRAQHEAAWRPKANWKYNLGSSRVCKNLRGQRPYKGRNIVSRKKVQLGGYTCANMTFLIVDQSLPNF